MSGKVGLSLLILRFLFILTLLNERPPTSLNHHVPVYVSYSKIGDDSVLFGIYGIILLFDAELCLLHRARPSHQQTGQCRLRLKGQETHVDPASGFRQKGTRLHCNHSSYSLFNLRLWWFMLVGD